MSLDTWNVHKLLCIKITDRVSSTVCGTQKIGSHDAVNPYRVLTAGYSGRPDENEI